MKKILTKYFGEMEVDETTLLRFDEGLWGFEGNATYALISLGVDEADGEGLMCLQSDEDPSLAFVVINPFLIQPEYAPRLEPADEKALGIEADTPVSFLAVVVVKDDPENSTANLRCPIAVNTQTRAARQVLLPDEYPSRCPLAAGEKEG